MRQDPVETDRLQSHNEAMATLARLRRKRARAKPIGRQAPVNTVASFGLIIGLMLVWAMTAAGM